MKLTFSLIILLFYSVTSFSQTCTIGPSTISTTDETRICMDGIPDPIAVSIDVEGGGTGTWVVTGPSNNILALYPGSPFDFEGAGAGVCIIHYVNSDDPGISFPSGSNLDAIVAASSCAFMSNPIPVDRIVVTAATISTPDATTICVDDGVDEPINVTINNPGTATDGAWVITDATGTIVGLPPAPPFVLDGAGTGTCSIWWVNYDDPAFTPMMGDDAAAIVAAATCAELSNPITITRNNCNACTATAADITTTDPTRICVDGIPDPINVTFNDAGMGTGAWVITDAANTILGLPPGPPFDLDGAGPGQCLIWYVTFDDPAFTPMMGDDAAAIVAASSCAFLSNPITVDRIEVTAATISTTDATTICVDDGIDEPIDVTIDDAGIGANGAWVITDATGTIVGLPPGPPFVLDGAGTGTCSIWWVNYDDPAFTPMMGDDAAAIVAAASCAALSNPITITRNNCNTCAAGPADITTSDPTRICVDGVPDPINVTFNDAGMGTGAWVITDATGTILGLPPGPPFDLDGAGPGQCLIWYVTFDDPAFTPMMGDDAAAIVAASSCAFLSNPITVDRIEVTAATISTTDATTICVDDGIDEPIDVTIDDAGIGANGAWVITDATGTIVGLPPGPPFVLDGAGTGTCSIWWVNYDDPAFTPMMGDDAAAIVAAASCAALSNPITITRNNCGPCDEEITYDVAANGCDMTGAMIELQDDNGAPIDAMPLGVNGGMGTFGLQPCGNYQIIITGAPICYTNTGGDVGPRAFMTDGTGTNNESFSSQPGTTDIPTLSEWGLITLALLLMAFGSVKMAVGNVAFAGIENYSIPIPSKGSFKLPYDAVIFKRALLFTGIFIIIGFAISIAIYGAVFMPDIIGVMIAGPIFTYLVHLLYFLESQKEK